MEQELCAALGLVVLADFGGHRPEPTERPQEPPVRRFRPAHVARPPPAVGTERVETTVIPDPVRRIALHGVPTEVAQLGPAGEEAGRRGDDRGHGGTTVLARERLSRGESFGVSR